MLARRSRVLVVTLVCFLGVVGGTPAGAGAEPLSGSPPHADSPFIRDRFGRVVFFHGVNAAWKLAPYYPPSSLFGQSKSYFDDRDARFLRDSGLNHVRLGVFFAGVMPEKGRIDHRYLDRIEKIVDMLGRRGVSVLLDFHQDMYNERFGGEGFPDWAVITDGIPFRPVFGFPFDYFQPAVSRAFDNFWANRAGLQESYAAAWAAVARRFRDSSTVVGYDLMNEPSPGSQAITCFPLPAGCPAFELLFLQPFFERVIAAIRTVDRRHMTFWESHYWTSGAFVQNWTGTDHPVRDPAGNTGLSFHAYCTAALGLPEPVLRATDVPCALSEEGAFRTHRRAAIRNGSALLFSEFGASDDLVDIARLTAMADEFMVSWDYWAYANWNDPTGNPPAEGMFEDDLDRPGSLKEDKALVLIRTYPQAVAGTPLSFSFDPESPDRTFTITYRTDRSIRQPTVIFVPVKWHYPRGYRVDVEGPARVTSDPNQPRLTLRNTGTGTVTVTVRRR
ncbi:MAG: cellulase family glycosylhydrolase [Actinomycetota bacterium]